MLLAGLATLCASSPPASGQPPDANPLAGRHLFVDPSTAARRQAEAWRPARPADAAALDRISSQPQAEWYGDWDANVRAAVARRVGAAARARSLPVLVAYDLPDRDCRGFSAGGAGSAKRYRRWIRSFAAGIGRRPAAVILEPDGLAGLDCLSPRRRARRIALLREAVVTLKANPATSLYLDAGHSAWHSAALTATRLRRAGLARADGFALDVSNFRPTPELLAYGQDLSARTGGKHFVLDTSRNGALEPADGWCNPDGRALGAAPNTAVGTAHVDAYLWIKPPGESDGPCHGGPAAGRFWPEYALGLARRAR